MGGYSLGSESRQGSCCLAPIALESELIVGVTTLVARALQHETRSIPLVLLNVTDPVGSGFAANLARPGGNSTGFIDLEDSLGGKWIELIRELVPRVNRVGMLFNPDTAAALDYYLPSSQAATRRLGVELVMGGVRSAGEIELFVGQVARSQDSAIAVMPNSFPGTHRDTIVSLVNQRRVPTIYPWRYMTVAGGLLSYGVGA
jgi:putative ABC transport system substrate-binding protein